MQEIGILPKKVFVVRVNNAVNIHFAQDNINSEGKKGEKEPFYQR